ncbi:MAG: hypothetical protein LBS91_00015 [Clostridiales Family XIII bacterium]|nr:hypothetical protein [Clostridiales Family XIII bacterium]
MEKKIVYLEKSAGSDAYHPENSAIRMAREIARGHRERKKKLQECLRRINEIRQDVLSPKIDGMPHTNRPYTDRIGERVAKIEDLQKYIDRNKEMVDVVEASYDKVCRGRHISKSMIAAHGSKSEILGQARQSMRLAMEHKNIAYDDIYFAWSPLIWKQERRAFLLRIARSLYLGDVPDCTDDGE